jgi:hypothetical protein
MKLHVVISIEDTHTWCGELLSSEPHFKSAEFAAINGLFRTENTVCKDCAERIIQAINNCL